MRVLISSETGHALRRRAVQQQVRLIALWMLLLSMTGFGTVQAQSFGQSDLTAAVLKAVPLSMGGAYRALANDTNALLYNPAGLYQRGGMRISAEYLDSTQFDLSLVSGSFIDSRAGRSFAYGASFEFVDQALFNIGVDMYQYTLGVALPIGEYIRLGATGKYYDINTSSTLASVSDEFTGDLGMLARLGDHVSLGVTLNNLYTGTGNPNIPMQLAGAIAFFPTPDSALLVDLVKDFSSPLPNTLNFHVGGQFALSRDLLFRSGFGLDEIRDNRFLGTGVVIRGPRANLSITYAHYFEPSEDAFAVMLEMIGA